eukprot:CAMPEP_0195118064 /NCGR_PEP_ID=MMETSP0448-20130528/115982_1 /TAXON_ID=66468 /ORGANISM="Heterocapsa triquestra, Strain CCMP 448" /LENGTH=251 /DNA_ID=CAMNT_0040155315 /DNA_START=1 /DNA_END=752 /DNA_ORIENTATION=+
MARRVPRALQPAEYDLLLRLDKELYPTDNPVTVEALRTWFSRNPEFGMVFDAASVPEQQEAAAPTLDMSVSIPLSEHGWAALLSGEVAESELSAEHIFDGARDEALGIHCYHVERGIRVDASEASAGTSGAGRGAAAQPFYTECLEALGHVCRQLQGAAGPVRVIGFSALCVTPAGNGLFGGKLGCAQVTVPGPHEHVVRDHRTGELQLLLAEPQELDARLRDWPGGCEHLSPCQMYAARPGDESVVWRYL